MAPQVRLELTTLRLTAECSAIELLRNIFSFSLPLCCSLMFESGKNFRSSRSPLDPGNFLLSQAVPSSVPSAFGGLTSVFGMGTGGALQLSSPETFLRGALPRFSSASLRSLRFRSASSPLGSLPLPAPSKLHRSELTSKLSLFFVSRSRSLALSPLPRPSRSLSLARSSSSDQALDRLVSPSSTPHSASTDDLSTSSSLRGLTCLKQWQSSSSGGLHA